MGSAQSSPNVHVPAKGEMRRIMMGHETNEGTADSQQYRGGNGNTEFGVRKQHGGRI